MASSNQETSFLYGLNETYIAELYKRYLDSPDSVDASWSDFFERLNEDEQAILDDMRGASWAPRQTRSEEHTSELQSLMRNSYAVFCLKKKNTTNRQIKQITKQIHNTTTHHKIKY